MEKSKIDILNSLGKEYFTFADLEKVFKQKEPTLLVTLSRMVKKGEIIRLAKGVYKAPSKLEDTEKIACQLYQPSYISFESALSRYGAVSQILYSITLATTKKPKKMTIGGQEITYRRLKKELFWGYNLVEGIYLAFPEKALLDMLYMRMKGRAQINLNELDLKVFNKKKILSFAKKYPPFIQNQAKKLFSKPS